MILLNDTWFLPQQKRDTVREALDERERQMWAVAERYNISCDPDYDWSKYWDDALDGPRLECWCPDWARECHDYVEYCPRHGFYCPLDLKPHPSTLAMYKGEKV